MQSLITLFSTWITRKNIFLAFRVKLRLRIGRDIFSWKNSTLFLMIFCLFLTYNFLFQFLNENSSWMTNLSILLIQESIRTNFWHGKWTGPESPFSDLKTGLREAIPSINGTTAVHDLNYSESIIIYMTFHLPQPNLWNFFRNEIFWYNNFWYIV